MATRKLFPKYFAKSSDSKKSTHAETPSVNKENLKDEFEEFSSSYKPQSLHRSRSGRLKEFSRLRLAISKDTFESPYAQSAPVTSTMAQPTTGLSGRELFAAESKRVSRSLQCHMNSTSEDAPPPHRNSGGDHRYGLDDNEIF